mgnify:FL=1
MKKISLLVILAVAMLLGACNLPLQPSDPVEEPTLPAEHGLATPVSEDVVIEILPTNTPEPTEEVMLPTNTAEVI